MSRVLSTDDFETVSPQWFETGVDPGAGAGTNKAIGSVAVRTGNAPGTPTEIYYKLNASPTKGWVKQNLSNLKVFNVTLAPYNCVADGVTDCTAGVQQAVTDANAAGGGIIYFPAAANFYRFAFGSISTAACIQVNNCKNLTFMGDGWASQLQGSGDWSARFKCLFIVNNQSQRIGFYNLRLSMAGVTNADPARTTSTLQVSSEVPDVGPPHDVDVQQCWFDPSWADGIRPIGGSNNSALKVTDVRVAYCMFNMDGGAPGDSRDCISAQRNVDRIQIYDNWFGPCGLTQDGQQIDFEPGGGDPPSQWDIVGNIIQNTNDVSITLSGVDATHGAAKLICAYNIIDSTASLRGGGIEAVLTPMRQMIHGNVIVMGPGTTSGTNAIEFRSPQNCTFCENIAISQSAAATRGAIYIFDDSGVAPVGCNIEGNLMKSIAAAANVSTFRFQGTSQFACNGNLVFSDNGTSVGSTGIQFRSTDFEMFDNACNGNLVVSTGAQNYLTGIYWTTAAPGFNQHNTQCSFNLIRNTINGITFDSSGAAFLDWRQIAANNCPNATSQSVAAPSTNVGVGIDGNAGPVSAQIGSIGVAAGPSGTMPASTGSWTLNSSGAQDTVLWYKESGGATTSGWVQDGAHEYVFGAQAGSVATAARFFATGIDLTAEGTVEIKLQCVRPGTIRNFRLQCVAGVGGGNNTYTVRKNGVNTGLAFTIANTATTGSNVANTFTVVAGDTLSIQVTKTVAPATPQTFIALTVEMSG